MTRKPRQIESVTVYAGASAGSQVMRDAALKFGELLADQGLGLVFGGGGIGMMGAVADGALARGGEVIGVIPDLFRRDLAHQGVEQIIETEGLAARKQKMFELGDAFVALPGGLGTVEELLEVWDWARLGIHNKPVGLLDVGGYYEGLLGFFDEMARREFCSPCDRGLLQVESDGEALLEALRVFEAPQVERWWAKF